MIRLAIFIVFLFAFIISYSNVIAEDTCVVIDKIAAADAGIKGLAWDDGYLWVSHSHYSAAVYKSMILKIDLSGNVLTSFNAPSERNEGEAYTGGLAFDGNNLWVLEYLEDKIYKLTTTGDVIDSIPSPGGSSGLTWDGENLWVSSEDSYKIYKINPRSGDILHSINAPGWQDRDEPDGLAWDGSHLWVSNTDGIYMVDPESGSILIESNKSEFKSWKAYGLTWDGQYLWAGALYSRLT